MCCSTWREARADAPRLALYEMVLRNIADGNWNMGRAEAITVNAYAREALGLYWAGCT
jgi:hypothetical protein